MKKHIILVKIAISAAACLSPLAACAQEVSVEGLGLGLHGTWAEAQIPGTGPENPALHADDLGFTEIRFIPDALPQPAIFAGMPTCAGMPPPADAGQATAEAQQAAQAAQWANVTAQTLQAALATTEAQQAALASQWAGGTAEALQAALATAQAQQAALAQQAAQAAAEAQQAALAAQWAQWAGDTAQALQAALAAIQAQQVAQAQQAALAAEQAQQAALAQQDSGTDSPPSVAPAISTQLEEDNQNTGVLAMQQMHSLKSQHLLYWFPMKMRAYHTKEQIQFFTSQKPEPFVRIGGISYSKVPGTTNCVLAVLEAIYDVFGGKNARINGISINDPIFSDFVPKFIQDGKTWIEPLVSHGIGAEVDVNDIRIGDIAQTQTHRFFVSEVGNGWVRALEAVPTPKSNVGWRTTNAIREGRKISVSDIVSVARLY